MDDILQNYQMHYFGIYCILKFCTEVISKSPVDNKSALDQMVVWHQTGNKPLPDPMMTQFTDACMHHRGLKHILW